jgi:hypothetical protein
MKRTIHPANVAENDIVEFVKFDYHKKSNTFIPKGTKARFLEWIKDEGIEFAYASIVPIDVDTKGWVWTNPDILVIEES